MSTSNSNATPSNRQSFACKAVHSETVVQGQITVIGHDLYYNHRHDLMEGKTLVSITFKPDVSTDNYEILLEKIIKARLEQWGLYAADDYEYWFGAANPALNNIDVIAIKPGEYFVLALWEGDRVYEVSTDPYPLGYHEWASSRGVGSAQRSLWR